MDAKSETIENQKQHHDEIEESATSIEMTQYEDELNNAQEQASGIDANSEGKWNFK